MAVRDPDAILALDALVHCADVDEAMFRYFTRALSLIDEASGTALIQDADIAAQLGISVPTACAARRKLLAKGFLLASVDGKLSVNFQLCQQINSEARALGDQLSREGVR